MANNQNDQQSQQGNKVVASRARTGNRPLRIRNLNRDQRCRTTTPPQCDKAPPERGLIVWNAPRIPARRAATGRLRRNES